MAVLIDTCAGIQSVLGTVYFKLAELITSKGEFVFKPLILSEIMIEFDNDESQPYEA